MASLTALHLLPPYRLEDSALPTAPYAVWVLLSDAVPGPAQWDISLALVRTGCRYAIASGPDCSSWDDSIDYAAIELLPEEAHVVTAWFDDESMEEVAEFFSRDAQTDDFTPEIRLILGLGQHAPVESALALVRAQAGSSAT